MTTGKAIALTRRAFVDKIMSLPFNMLSSFVIAFLLRSKRLLTLCLQSPSTVILEPKKKSATVSIFHPLHLFAMKWWDWMPWSSFFEYWILSEIFHPPLSPQDSLVPVCFLPIAWCHLHIWGYWYFSWQSWFQFELHPARHFVWCTLHKS